MKRRRARRLALQGLCCLDVRGPSAWETVELFLSDSREPSETVEAARELLKSAFAGQADCDALLARHARNWELNRLALVDRNILRLAVHEMISGRCPLKVAITEAMHLAREFSTAESSRFVNGVLDAVARELAKDAANRQE